MKSLKCQEKTHQLTMLHSLCNILVIVKMLICVTLQPKETKVTYVHTQIQL